ncbi:hypothetical protein M422DRAFT_34793 [Sphaerobolus stellatus SS14]|uniref:Uncharacterized protein n=1 Tax=Sphaerobolus stellatus (strain SS14) TaxID=990650 RepID=A0A0C9VCV6_SPHS4|nr:hypothetical protein M422DRAFT_34793 [Sphaerobolus stellatus SS14]
MDPISKPSVLYSRNRFSPVKESKYTLQVPLHWQKAVENMTHQTRDSLSLCTDYFHHGRVCFITPMPHRIGIDKNAQIIKPKLNVVYSGSSPFPLANAEPMNIFKLKEVGIMVCRVLSVSFLSAA